MLPADVVAFREGRGWPVPEALRDRAEEPVPPVADEEIDEAVGPPPQPLPDQPDPPDPPDPLEERIRELEAQVAELQRVLESGNGSMVPLPDD